MITKENDSRLLEICIYSIFSVASVIAVLLLFYRFPVTFTFLITEDFWGENLTFFCFLFSGILLLIYSLKKGPFPRRILWGLMGVFLLAIAGEEISWGQRIFQLPDIFGIKKINYQFEYNLHNIIVMHGRISPLYNIISYSIILCILFSAILTFRMEKLYDKLLNLGLPIIPVHLASAFVSVPVFWFFHPTVKSDEIGEMFLGIAILMWAVDLVVTKSSIKQPRRLAVVAIVLGALSMNLAAAYTLTIWQANNMSLKDRLNKMASRDYPARDMFPQSEELFRYLYTQPDYLYPYTRINHCLVSIKAGNAARAINLLTETSREIDFHNLREWERIEYLRILGVAYNRLNLKESADNAFNESIRIAHQQTNKATDPNWKARYILASAKTMNEWGHEDAARSEINKALALETVPAIRFMLEKYLRKIGITQY